MADTMSEAVTQTEAKGIPTPAELGFDPAALRQRYAAEREKRLREDANNQYQEITGAHEHYNVDPYVDPGFTRPALHEELDAVILGGGFGGLLAAARLQKAGITNIRIIEKAGDFGGTWYWNRYPGAQCDIESYVYLPLLEETGYMPKEKYSFAPEIFAHAQRIGKHFDLYKRACFQTQVKEARWDNEQRRSTVKTDRGDVFKARFMIMSSGPLNRPKLPAIPGIEKFKGHTFHTSRWDYDYTGGDTTGGLHKLADKRVGIIGTGATAIQCVSHLGEHSQQLYVFQRTPSSVDERGNKPTDPEWVKTLAPGWQAYRNKNFCCAPLRDSGRGGSGRRQVDEPVQESLPPARGDAKFGALQRTDGADVRDRRLPEDERDSRSRVVDRARPANRRGAQAVVRPMVQAPNLQRRVPAYLQPAQCEAGGYQG